MVIAGLQVILLLVAVTVHGRCLSSLDCVIMKRETCPPGSQKCGPCMPKFEESEFGKCELKVTSRLKFKGPDSEIDFIQEYRMSKGHRINPTETVSTITTTTAASPHLTSSGDKPKLLQNSSDAQPQPLLASTVPPQMKDRKLGRRRKSEMNQTMSLTLIVICSLTAVSGILVVALCWYRLQKVVLAQEMAYTAYKGGRQHTCPRSADQMSHYMQHYSAQKKHFQAQEGSSVKKPCQQLSTDSEADADEFAIYECPGLAPTGEMEIHNPLFDPSRSKQ